MQCIIASSVFDSIYFNFGSKRVLRHAQASSQVERNDADVDAGTVRLALFVGHDEHDEGYDGSQEESKQNTRSASFHRWRPLTIGDDANQKREDQHCAVDDCRPEG